MATNPISIDHKTESRSGYFKRIRRDIASVLERDPAARSKLEVALVYSGLHAILPAGSHNWRVGLPESKSTPGQRLVQVCLSIMEWVW